MPYESVLSLSRHRQEDCTNSQEEFHGLNIYDFTDNLRKDRRLLFDVFQRFIDNDAYFSSTVHNHQMSPPFDYMGRL